ncbi:MAG: hypothetical protein KC416_00965 [Myxococcales bacterium]|nr:hypothetical protein [Myxococcales bacterium]
MRGLLPLLLVAFVWLAILAAAATPWNAVFASPGPTPMRTEDIRPGMKGFGLTVFHGTKPERFEVEVIDTLQEFRPGQPLILVRTQHPVLEKGKVVAGMSGSPIYLEGKLAGAYSYGWSFGTDAMAGVTPIANMMDDLQRPLRSTFPGTKPLGDGLAWGQSAPGTPRTGRPAQAFYRGGRIDALAPIRAMAGAPGGHTPHGPVRAQTPMVLSGFGGHTATWLERELAPLGWVVLQGGGSGGTDASAPPRYEAGGAIAIQLLRGDVSMMGTGTVTHVDGHKLIAFGHPMLNAGEVALPAATARIVHTFTSIQRSFKLSDSGVAKGTLIQDRQASIVVDTDRVATTIPIRLKVRGIVGAPKTEWKMEAASHRALTPMLVFAGIINALETTASDRTDITYEVASKVAIEGHGTVAITDRGYMENGPNNPGDLSQLRLFSLLQAAYNNPFEESRVTSVDVEIRISFGTNYWEIIDAWTASSDLEPGSSVPLFVRLRRIGEPDRIEQIAVDIPEQAAGLKVELQIESGSMVKLERPTLRSLDDLLRLIQDELPATALVTSLRLPSQGLRFRGHVMDNLPGSVLESLRMTHRTDGGEPFNAYRRQVWDLSSIIFGSTKLNLNIRENTRKP